MYQEWVSGCRLIDRAFAFAPVWASNFSLSLPLLSLAALVACSRVHAGVHYPGDVIVGSIATGQVLIWLADRRSH
jgi:undecaprenyl-diphosphatase